VNYRLGSPEVEVTGKYYPLIAMMFITLLLTNNVMGEKPVVLATFVIPAGLLLFPLTYLLGDVLTEVYGFAAARRVVWMGMLCNLFMSFACRMVLQLPALESWEHNQAYEQVLTSSSRLMAISAFSYFTGEWTNAYIVSKLKEKMQGRLFWLRALCGSWIGEFVDSAIFIPLAFYGILSNEQLLKFMIFCYGFKVLYSFLTVPIASQFVKILKSKEKIKEAVSQKTRPSFPPFTSVESK